MSRVDGPVSMTVRIDMRVSGDIALRFGTEFVVTDAEEAGDKELVDAFSFGYVGGT